MDKTCDHLCDITGLFCRKKSMWEVKIYIWQSWIKTEGVKNISALDLNVPSAKYSAEQQKVNSTYSNT